MKVALGNESPTRNVAWEMQVGHAWEMNVVILTAVVPIPHQTGSYSTATEFLTLSYRNAINLQHYFENSKDV